MNLLKVELKLIEKMNKQKQDKLWSELSKESKEYIKNLNEALKGTSESYKELNLLENENNCKQRSIVLEDLFGSHNLDPYPLSYDDVAKKLFSNDAYWICSDGDIAKGEIYNEDISNATNCTSPQQAKKLLAINKLLNVAKYLNGDWKPDWEDENNEFYTLGFDPDDNSIRTIKVNIQRVPTEIIYFHTKELAKKAIDILDEDVIITALGDY